ncbi:MAG: MotA/TolQ/ExbB proton channel family protein [Carboxylicivirga sp.]|jgi:sterol desaturase/sphingolipid hydroxylase (fatty acid hydroxylase superfamily)|nr:MotA/TolQ/ExbB proton channel family protein [Carboxylicivirga sp.]
MYELLSIYPYTLLPLGCGLILIISGYVKLWKLRRSNHPEIIGIFGIWLMGLIGLLLGIFGQLLGIIEAFDTITQMGTISASIVADGIKNLYKPTLFGLGVLIISLIIWGILKGIKQKRIFIMTNEGV